MGGVAGRLTRPIIIVLVERLVAPDDEHRTLTYDIVESPFAVRRYVATIRVAPVTDAGTTFVEWSTESGADAADEEELMRTFGDGVFAGGLAGLCSHLGRRGPVVPAAWSIVAPAGPFARLGGASRRMAPGGE